MTMTRNQILHSLASDKDIQTILKILQELDLKDSWLCAGVVRNFIWNILSDKPGFDWQTDVDIIFYDQKLTWEDTNIIEEKLKESYPDYRWELRNQVYMHRYNPNTQPYTSSRDAMSRYPETCTAIGLRLDALGQLELFCPYGLDSIRSFEIRPTPTFKEDQEKLAIYKRRLAKKDWFIKWPQLSIYCE